MRALWRLVRALSNVLLGVLLCAVAFPFWSEDRRMRCVGWWSRRMLVSIGVRLEAEGSPIGGPALVVANHVSWIDIPAVNAVVPSRFVAKSEIRRWPILGWLTSNGGTLFIERGKRRDATRVVSAITDALRSGAVVAVFPEGTVNDGRTLLPFHANLLQSAVTAGAPIQPIAIRYTDDATREAARVAGRRAAPSRATAFEGDITLFQTVFAVLNARGLTVTVSCLPAIRTLPEASMHQTSDRRVLSDQARAMIERALAGG